MADRSDGLHRKFTVERTDGRSIEGEKHHGCAYFCLDLTHDSVHARAALEAYADSCAEESPILARDLRYVAGQSDMGAAAEAIIAGEIVPEDAPGVELVTVGEVVGIEGEDLGEHFACPPFWAPEQHSSAVGELQSRVVLLERIILAAAARGVFLRATSEPEPASNGG